MKIALYDCLFSQNQASATLGGDCLGETPQHFEWDRFGTGPLTFFTDSHLREALHTSGVKVAWLLEPYQLRADAYRDAVELEGAFDYILTHNEEYAARGGPWLWYPFGGSWIREQDWHMMHPKTRGVSLIASEKTGMRGHQLRHEAAAAFSHLCVVMGRGYRIIPSKLEGLTHYRYSIVIENCHVRSWFTEKLIDCIACGTVPIYWGTDAVLDLFDPAGIIPFRGLDGLGRILNDVVSTDDYQARRPALERNMQTARQYRCVEDWIWKEYPQIFEAAK